MKKLKFSNGIVCPMCGGKTKVAYTTDAARRNRTCKDCGHKYRTVEILEEETVLAEYEDSEDSEDSEDTEV